MIYLHENYTYIKNRKERLPVIIDLLTHKIIGTQEELLAELSLLGFTVTQATLSRDLKHLNTAKVSNGIGGYRYVVSSFGEEDVASRPFKTELPVRLLVRSIDRSSNIIVIKAPATHTKFLSQTFDSLRDSRILASISVTDTLLLVLAPHMPGDVIYDLLTSVMSVDIVAPYRACLDHVDA